jgi:hypothetical protein
MEIWPDQGSQRRPTAIRPALRARSGSAAQRNANNWRPPDRVGEAGVIAASQPRRLVGQPGIGVETAGHANGQAEGLADLRRDRHCVSGCRHCTGPARTAGRLNRWCSARSGRHTGPDSRGWSAWARLLQQGRDNATGNPCVTTDHSHQDARHGWRERNFDQTVAASCRGEPTLNAPSRRFRLTARLASGPRPAPNSARPQSQILSAAGGAQPRAGCGCRRCLAWSTRPRSTPAPRSVRPASPPHGRRCTPPRRCCG